MSKKYRALVCCRAGVGASTMLQIKCDQVIIEEDYPIETVRDDVDALESFDGDLVITMSDLAEDLERDGGHPYVVGVRNIVDKGEIRDRLEEFLEHVGEREAPETEG